MAMDPAGLVRSILRRHETMVANRATFDALFTEVADRVSPTDSIFLHQNTAEGQKRTQRLFDSTAVLASGRCAAAVESMVAPRTQRWHGLQATDKAVRNSKPVKEYLEEVLDVMFAARYAPKANFASQFQESLGSVVNFGTGSVMIDEILGIALRYKSLHLSETYIAENAAGIIDTLHRPFDFTARQAVQQFGVNALHDKIKSAAENAPDSKFKFLQCVYPNTDRIPGRLDYLGMAYRSYYVVMDGALLVSEGGYRTFPAAIGRYRTAPRELYGRGPAIDALPSIVTLNEQKKTVLRAGQKVVDPPLLLQDDGALMAFDMRSGALNYSSLSMAGEPLVKPLITNARIDIGKDLMDDERQLINDHFLVTLFQVLVENPQMTATEAMLRAQEKGALLGPTMGRLQSEMLGPMIERELDLLAHAGQLPDMPPELIQAGGAVEIVYTAPLNRAQKAEEGMGVLQIFSAAAQMAQAKPEVFDKLDIDAGMDVLADVYGTPSKVMVSPEVLKARRDQRNQSAQTQQLIEAAPQAASAAKDLATAQSVARSAPPMPLPG